MPFKRLPFVRILSVQRHTEIWVLGIHTRMAYKTDPLYSNNRNLLYSNSSSPVFFLLVFSFDSVTFCKQQILVNDIQRARKTNRRTHQTHGEFGETSTYTKYYTYININIIYIISNIYTLYGMYTDYTVRGCDRTSAIDFDLRFR